jgi:hypothetical protein
VAPKALDAIVDVVLAYKPKPRSKPAKMRKRRAAKARSVEAGPRIKKASSAAAV